MGERGEEVYSFAVLDAEAFCEGGGAEVGPPDFVDVVDFGVGLWGG